MKEEEEEEEESSLTFILVNSCILVTECYELNAPLLPVSLANKILKYYRRDTIVLYSLAAGTVSTGGRSQTDLALV